MTWALGTAVLMFAIVACSSAAKVAKPPPAPGPNPDVIPAVITPAYVNAVFKVLNHIYGSALREEVTTHRVDNTVMNELTAIYVQPQLSVEESIFRQALRGSLNYVLANPGDRVFSTMALESASPQCIQAKELADYSLVDRTHSPNQMLVVVLTPRKSQAGSHDNSTPWSISYEKTEPPAQTCPT